MIYTLDTNVIAEVLKGNKVVLENMRLALSQGNTVTLNSICYYEAKRVLIETLYQRKRSVFDALVERHGVLTLNQTVLDQAAMIYNTLRQEGLLIEDADILVAASAMVYEATLVTNNTQHFKRIQGLMLAD